MSEQDSLVSLKSLQQWRAFLADNAWAVSTDHIEGVVKQIADRGFRSDFFGKVSPADIEIRGDNWRETIVVHGCNARSRSMLDLIARLFPDTSTRLLMLEAITPFALAIRGRYAFALGSEYFLTDEDRIAHFPIPHCDIQNPAFPPGVFQLIVSNDVLEHVPDLNVALKGMADLLPTGGVMLATFPFGYMDYETVVRAKLVDGEVVHLLPPEYHGNPIAPGEGSLVFSVPCWDILDRCKAAGFSDAEVVFDASPSRGITATELAGILILKAVK